MRTTVDLDSHSLATAKRLARRAEMTLSQVVRDAIRVYAERSAVPATFTPITAGNPGDPAPTWEEIERLLEEDDIAHFRSKLADADS